MKILLLANFSKTSISGYVYQTLVNIGHDVVFVSPQAENNMIACESRVDVPKLIQRLNFNPDLLLMVESSVHPLLLPIGLENVTCITTWWAIDNHINYRWHKEFAVFFDYVYFAQKDFVKPAIRYSNKNIQWLPLACEPTIQTQLNLTRDIACGFVGNMNKYRQKYFDMLTSNTPIEMVSGLNPTEMSSFYNHCQMVFNLSMRGDLNMRTFEAMSCGCLLITQDIQNGLRDLFVPDEHIVVHHLNDAASIIDLYKKMPEKVMEIAQNGYELVRNKHTYMHRVNQILADVKGSKADRFDSDIYITRKYFMMNHRQFKIQKTDEIDAAFNNQNLLKKVKYKFRYLKEYIWQKKYLSKIKKFG